FFFSSRRRHTRLVSDWSSDVCSSDLKVAALTFGIPNCLPQSPFWVGGLSVWLRAFQPKRASLIVVGLKVWVSETTRLCKSTRGKIGRASCRERVEMWVGAGGLKRKRK